jgi:PAS domain S-box-containing protein
MSEKPTYEELEKRVLELEKNRHELKETEALLKDKISWQRLFIKESRDGIVIVDANAKVREANKRFADMLGYPMEEIHQLHVWDWDAKFQKGELLKMAQAVDNLGHHFETRHRRKDGTLIDVELSNNGAFYRGQKLIFCICRDITDKKKAVKEREKLIQDLKEALAEIKTLRGILPLCSFCKKIRDDEGYWEQVDIYINKNSEADISHGICPDCMKKHYPDVYKKKYNR